MPRRRVVRPRCKFLVLLMAVLLECNILYVSEGTLAFFHVDLKQLTKMWTKKQKSTINLRRQFREYGFAIDNFGSTTILHHERFFVGMTEMFSPRSYDKNRSKKNLEVYLNALRAPDDLNSEQLPASEFAVTPVISFQPMEDEIAPKFVAQTPVISFQSFEPEEIVPSSVPMLLSSPVLSSPVLSSPWVIHSVVDPYIPGSPSLFGDLFA